MQEVDKNTQEVDKNTQEVDKNTLNVFRLIFPRNTVEDVIKNTTMKIGSKEYVDYMRYASHNFDFNKAMKFFNKKVLQETGDGFRNMFILEGTASIGTDTLKLMKWFKNIIAVEINKIPYDHLVSHTETYDKIKTINGDITKEYKNDKSNVFYLDPPWAPKEGKIMLGKIEFQDFLNTLVHNIIIIKIPLFRDYKIEKYERWVFVTKGKSPYKFILFINKS